MKDDLSKKALRVSECVELIRTSLQAVIGDLSVIGEISGLQKRSGNTLVFFSLKDDQSYVDCFMLAHELKTPIDNGMEVCITGYPSLFKKSGKFHMRVKEVQAIGEGALQKQLERTKKKLEQEGLFEVSRKRPVPRFPFSIGIITSDDAAAFTDVVRVLSHRWPCAELTLVPSQVQGKPAISHLLHALDTMEQRVRPEVILLTRGGGNLEDLQAFNSEDLARKIFSCSIPVIVGVGHERDWTIADLVADVRAATPSNAAELATPDQQDVFLQIDAITDGIRHVMRRRLESASHALFRSTTSLSAFIESSLSRFDALTQKVSFFGKRLSEEIELRKERIGNQLRSIVFRLHTEVERTRKQITQTTVVLEKTSPQHILRKGYTMTTRNGRIVRSRAELQSHDILTTAFHDGEVESEVTKIV